MARYSKEYKAEALKLSDELGVKKAAAQLGIQYYTLADWRNNLKHAESQRNESFIATLKKEKIYQIAAYKLTGAQVKNIVFRYFFTYYNRIRVCSVTPGGLPPVKYREWVAAHTA